MFKFSMLLLNYDGNLRPQISNDAYGKRTPDRFSKPVQPIIIE